MAALTNFLRAVTMYRLILYFLLILVVAAAAFAAVGILPYDPAALLSGVLVLIAISWGVNQGIARMLHSTPNPESSMITGLILGCIMGPFSFGESMLPFGLAAAAAAVSKYLLAWRKSHILNPAAVGALVAGFSLGEGASWWIGNTAIFPIVLLGGLVIAIRIRRLALVGSFIAVYVGATALDFVIFSGRSITEVASAVAHLFVTSPLLFFSFVMLVEPLTSPAITRNRILFGVLVGSILVIFQRFFSSIPYPLEISLIIGNVFARMVSQDFRQTLHLAAKEMFSPSIGGFWFEPVRPFSFTPGQFLEYTLPHHSPDQRGIRRYFTIASSPTEKNILIVTRFANPGSSFKKALREMNVGDEIVASKVSGDFVVPDDPGVKLVFIAGGIGVTPFRSIVKFLLDTQKSRDVVFIYAVRTAGDLVFRDLFETASVRFGMRIAYVIADPMSASSVPGSRVSQFVDEATIRWAVPDITERTFLVSGPEPMVEAIGKTLGGMGIPKSRIMRDYFPGYQEH